MPSVLKLIVIAFIAGLLVASGPALLQGQAPPGPSISAVAGQKGGWDVIGPYDVIRTGPNPCRRCRATRTGRGARYRGSSPRAPIACTAFQFPGAFFNMHCASVDQEGNLYVAGVGGGRVQEVQGAGGSQSFVPHWTARVFRVEIASLNSRAQPPTPSDRRT